MSSGRTPQELIGQAASELAAANPLLRTQEEQRAFIEGFLNGTHWSFSVVRTSVSNWIEGDSSEPRKDPPPQS